MLTEPNADIGAPLENIDNSVNNTPLTKRSDFTLYQATGLRSTPNHLAHSRSIFTVFLSHLAFVDMHSPLRTSCRPIDISLIWNFSHPSMKNGNRWENELIRKLLLLKWLYRAGSLELWTPNVVNVNVYATDTHAHLADGIAIESCRISRFMCFPFCCVHNWPLAECA